MTSHVSGARPHTAARGTEASGFVGGWTMFAAVMMIFGGLMAIFAGIAAIAQDDVFVRTPSYIFRFNLTGWGWIHLLLGIVILVAGFALLQGAMWARITGVALAGMGMFANFLWLPYAPFWALTLIAIDAFIIWALCTPRRSEA
ncbi:DUF7144 family membrane protein [Streptomyces sp. SP18CS02]|uniref:DUF7144 family membrane protein n=1 Tax=Streptomyces sp. SP18CS02 TaxID=3002531 RepID=UPI002E79D033|nr:hypothetical protein [Streptomyces sp. SP18CS02]MEE1752132.1 hypothetical protein [Streptomyces sp. SP18CS02]